MQTNDTAISETTDIHHDTENAKSNYRCISRQSACVYLCDYVRERVLGGGGCCSLDRLGAPAGLHILSSSVVCWDSSDYRTTLTKNSLKNTHAT